MKNPEYSFARAFGQSAGVATFSSPRTGIAFAVDLSHSAAEGQDEVGNIVSLTWADARTPVAVLGICLGKLFLASALNPLDPSTRAFMQRVSQSGELPYIVLFSSTGQQVAGLVKEQGLFDDVLRATVGRQLIRAEHWREVSAHAMAHGLLDEGFSARVRSRLEVRAFSVLSDALAQLEPDPLAMC